MSISTIDLLSKFSQLETHRCMAVQTPDHQPMFWVKVDGQWQSVRPVVNRDPQLNGFDQAIVERVVRQAIVQKPFLDLSISLVRPNGENPGRFMYEVQLNDSFNTIASSNSAADLLDAILLSYVGWLDTLEFQQQIQAEQAAQVELPTAAIH